MSILNNSNTDKFKTVFSNIPVPSTRNDKINLDCFNNYIRNVTLPDYNVEVMPSEFMQTSMKNPISRFNNDMSPITIEFVTDEDIENYTSFFEWMREIRLGNHLKGETSLRESTIKSLYILIIDNQNRNVKKIIFKDLLLIGLSPLNLQFGQSEQSIFTITLQYNTMDIERVETVRNN